MFEEKKKRVRKKILESIEKLAPNYSNQYWKRIVNISKNIFDENTDYKQSFELFFELIESMLIFLKKGLIREKDLQYVSVIYESLAYVYGESVYDYMGGELQILIDFILSSESIDKKINELENFNNRRKKYVKSRVNFNSPFFEDEMREFYKNKNNTTLFLLLKKIRDKLVDFVENRGNALDYSNEFNKLTIVYEDEIFRHIVKKHPELESLKELISLSHPDLDKEKMRGIVNKQIEKLNSVLEKYLN